MRINLFSKILLILLVLISTNNSSSSMNEKEKNKTELTTFGGGCFWCLEAVFRLVPGVISITNGYAGGFTKNPTYKEVCSGNTGHAEVVQIEYDPKKISFKQLLELFWKSHDPTSLNRQGADIGTQYRSIILYHNEYQKKIAEESKAEISKQFVKPIVTVIVPFNIFYKAEEYHQDFYRKNPEYGYCRAVIKPKLDKLKSVLKKN